MRPCQPLQRCNLEGILYTVRGSSLQFSQRDKRDSFLLMLGMKEPGIDTSLEWAPDWYLLLTYAWPFTVGWLAWHHRGVIDELRRWCWLRLGAAVFLLVLAVGGMLAWHASQPPSAWLFPVVQLLFAAGEGPADR